MSLNANYELWVIIVCYRFTDSKQCTCSGVECISVEEVVYIWGHICGCVWELFVLSVQFCYEFKTTLRNKVY